MKNLSSLPIRKERLSPTSKTRSKASRKKFMEKSGIPVRVESLGEINSSKNCRGSLFRFVKLIENGLRKVKYLIESRPTRTETDAGENDVRLQKKE